jgi:hypothetical protein
MPCCLLSTSLHLVLYSADLSGSTSRLPGTMRSPTLQQTGRFCEPIWLVADYRSMSAVCAGSRRSVSGIALTEADAYSSLN